MKYGHYAFRISEAHYNGKLCKMVIVVIYTGDVTTAPNSLDLGCIQLHLQQVFLSNFDGNKIYDELKIKVHNNEPLTDEDVMRFIILPLTEKSTSGFWLKTQ